MYFIQTLKSENQEVIQTNFEKIQRLSEFILN